MTETRKETLRPLRDTDGRVGDAVPVSYRGRDYIAMKFKDGWKYAKASAFANVDIIIVDPESTFSVETSSGRVFLDAQRDDSGTMACRSVLGYALLCGI